jgi:histidine triad (HIT) family protein
MEDCIFCKIVKREVPSHKVWEDDDLLAFLDIQPINKGHVLIIPKQHSALISGVEDEVLGKMMTLAKKIDKALRESDIKAEDVNLHLADGKIAGQEVPHVHFHVIPRFKDDGFGFNFPMGYKNKPTQEELEEVSKKITLHLN